MCLTKLDVLDGFETIKLCTSYNRSGDGVAPNFGSEYYDEITPVYEEVPGWSESTVGAKSVADLPENARLYIARVEEAVGAPIDIISTGPDRGETIVLNNPFD